MTDHITQHSRYHHAAVLLDDCVALARLAHAAADVTASEEPCALALSGGRRLRNARRIGLFAGSFNPLTRAHVALVNAARRAASLDVVVWACAAASVDKERVARAALVDRLAQMRAFMHGRRHDALALLNRGLYVDEAQTIRTLLASSAELVILVGYDKIVQIFDPKYYNDRDAALHELFSLANILVAPRGDDSAEALAALLAQPENRPFAANVQYLDAPPTYATYARDSSTEARTLAAEQPPDVAVLSHLLPPAGLALALHTGAYQHATPTNDPYDARVRWLDVLAYTPPPIVRRLPPLTTLVRETVADDASGRDLRAWLDDSRHDVDALAEMLQS